MISRRQLLGALGALPAVGASEPGALYAQATRALPQRLLGRTGRSVVPLGLGGQAGIQWPLPGLDTSDLIVRAIQVGLNYLDTSNAYGPSQTNYGAAFRRLHLTPMDLHYDRAARERLYVATKTVRRYGFSPEIAGPTAVDDLKTSLTVMFGDGKNLIPEGAYVDAMQIHALGTMNEVDQIYEGYGMRGGRAPEHIGALPALLDYRDGTNNTGLNPEHRQYIRHLGITGHQSSPVLMRAIRRDTSNILDTVLVALNSLDLACSSHQNNVLPLAMARGLGVIGMKVFANGSYFGKEPGPNRSATDVRRFVGKADAVSYSDLVRYTLSLPGVSVAVVGIGQIDREKAEADQIVANLAAAVSDMPSGAERLRIERESLERHNVNINYFQEKANVLIQPTQVAVKRDGELAIVEWNTAVAGAVPLGSYEIRADNRLIQSLPFRPQLTEAPLSLALPASEIGEAKVTVVAREAPNRR